MESLLDNGVGLPERQSYAVFNYTNEIVLDESFYYAFESIRISKKSKQCRTLLNVTGETNSNFDHMKFIQREELNLVNFAVRTLGHELQHAGAYAKGLPQTASVGISYIDERSGEIGSTVERGEMYEVNMYNTIVQSSQCSYLFEVARFYKTKQPGRVDYKKNIYNIKKNGTKQYYKW
jgi:hypothetical protein